MDKRNHVNKVNFLFLALSSLLLALSFILPDSASSGPYLDSAHGNTSYGVNRTSLSTFGYSTGNCAHCHEQHASIGGSAPAPDGTNASIYCLFYNNHVSQTDNFCYKCHTDLSSLQTGGLINRSYSYRAGGYTSDTLNDILQAFSFTSPGSSHNLGNIRTFLTGKSWGYTSDSNPCGGCHNPHRVQGDPADLPNSAKSSVTRGWPVSRPSQHSTDNDAWGLWGDNLPAATERMSNYATGYRYQAPYRVGGATYEPDGSATQNGSNLTDYVTFCQDCHLSSMTAYGLSNTPINWETGDKHGKTAATATSGNYIDIDTPFSNTYGGQYVLACTDCHEPHGAPNLMLIRKEVNGTALAGTISTLTPVDCTATYLAGNKYLGYLCNRCHKDDADAIGGTANNWCYVHHQSTDAFYTGGMCNNCHDTVGMGGGTCNRTVSAIDCNCCHYHGSTYSTWTTF
ncbi:MAG: hypothetical protein AB1390_04420 [Nitrospirota bacterium]